MKGGYRIGSGRPKGSRNRKKKSETRIISGAGFLATAEKFAEFYKGLLDRSAKGEKPTEDERKQMNKLASELTKNYGPGGENKPVNIITADAKTYLEELLISVSVDQKSKIQIANILMPYQHKRKGETPGKKEQAADRAKQVGSGRFATGKPPLALVK